MNKHKAAIAADLLKFALERGVDVPAILAEEFRKGPPRWRCKRCGQARRRSECLSCGNRAPLTNERSVSGLIR